MKQRYSLLLVVAMACGGIVPSEDAPPAMGRCDPTAKFSAPVAVPGLATASFAEGVSRFSPDELTVYLGGGPRAPSDLYVAQRNSLAEAFMAPALITSQMSSAHDASPAVSPDGLVLWFESNRSNAKNHVYTATRASILSEFGTPGLATAVNSIDLGLYEEAQPFMTADSAELWFVSNRNNGNDWDIWYSMRTVGGFSQPVNVLGLNSLYVDFLPTLSADRLTVYFSSNREGRSYDIWTAHRSTINDGFPAPVIVGEINSTASDHPSWLSADGCRLYISSDRSGEPDVYMATRQP